MVLNAAQYHCIRKLGVIINLLTLQGGFICKSLPPPDDMNAVQKWNQGKSAGEPNKRFRKRWYCTYNGCAFGELFPCFSNESPDVHLGNMQVLHGRLHHTVFDDCTHDSVLQGPLRLTCANEGPNRIKGGRSPIIRPYIWLCRLSWKERTLNACNDSLPFFTCRHLLSNVMTSFAIWLTLRGKPQRERDLHVIARTVQTCVRGDAHASDCARTFMRCGGTFW